MAKQRNRERDHAGKSERSHLKHDLIKRAVHGQFYAWRYNHDGRIALIDMNAGDGIGVTHPQLDLLEGERQSLPTAELAVRLANSDGNADVFLCEKNGKKRAKLAELFPTAIILDNHSEVLHHLVGYRYVIVISDPCGPRDHGIEWLQQIAQTIPYADFIVAFNEGTIQARYGSGKVAIGSPSHVKAFNTGRDIYLPMIEPRWWARTLGRTRLARTSRVINGSANFKYRILVIANWLANPVTRAPFEVLHDRKTVQELSRVSSTPEVSSGEGRGNAPS